MNHEVEAVAEAIYECRRSQELGWKPWSLQPENVRQKWRESAQAAIQKMEDISDE